MWLLAPCGPQSHWATSTDFLVLRIECVAQNGRAGTCRQKPKVVRVKNRKYLVAFWTGYQEKGVMVVHTHARGQGAAEASAATRKAMGTWSPRAVVGVGCAFGLGASSRPHDKLQVDVKLGDVLVGEYVLNFDWVKQGKVKEWRSVPEVMLNPWNSDAVKDCAESFRMSDGYVTNLKLLILRDEP